MQVGGDYKFTSLIASQDIVIEDTGASIDIPSTFTLSDPADVFVGTAVVNATTLNQVSAANNK